MYKERLPTLMILRIMLGSDVKSKIATDKPGPLFG